MCSFSRLSQNCILEQGRTRPYDMTVGMNTVDLVISKCSFTLHDDDLWGHLISMTTLEHMMVIGDIRRSRVFTCGNGCRMCFC